MNFGEPSPRSVDAANGFMVERVKKTPPPGGIGLSSIRTSFLKNLKAFGALDLDFPPKTSKTSNGRGRPIF